MLGKIIAGYELVEFIGKGQFGTVYKCKRNDQDYAIKIFNTDFVMSEFKKGPEDNRILREIQALKTISHCNVIQIFDEGFFNDNNQSYVYIIMEYLRGQDLSNFLKTSNPDIDTVLDIFEQILEGLEAVHNKNIIHRDLKPQNIFIDESQTIKLLDFGLAKLIDFTSITSTGDTVGSPIYMSPEQIKDSKNIDYRSDFYAIGVILFELLTRKFPYGDVNSVHELYYKIINEPPLSVLQFEPSTPNSIDNLICSLLEKINYKRPSSKDKILGMLRMDNRKELASIISFEPNFYLRVWNEKTVLQQFYKDGYHVDNVIFPINHQGNQKGLLSHVKEKNINFMIDPATMRLAYDTFADVKGLTELPYAPSGFSKLELDNLSSIKDKRKYVELVINEQIKHCPNYLVSPFHVSNNSNFASIKNENTETWFSLDIKLLKETKDYIIKQGIAKKLVGGFCIRADVLATNTEKKYFLNVLSGLPCDIYWIYVDCISYQTSKSQLYHYMSTLLELQQSTNKPVIAGRVGSIGLLLLAFGLYGFESGASRFESFYEDLYKPSESYNMYVTYYIPELLKSVAVERKNPAKLISILNSNIGVNLQCDCIYCQGKDPSELPLTEADTRKHFLLKRQQEVAHLRNMGLSERVDYMESKIKKALHYYKNLKPVFKSGDYAYLQNWLEVIPQLREDFNI